RAGRASRGAPRHSCRESNRAPPLALRARQPPCTGGAAPKRALPCRPRPHALWSHWGGRFVSSLMFLSRRLAEGPGVVGVARRAVGSFLLSRAWRSSGCYRCRGRPCSADSTEINRQVDTIWTNLGRVCPVPDGNREVSS